MRVQHPSRLSGFTLIELLVVISIVLIASSIIFIGGNSGSGSSLSSSMRIVSGIAQGARGQALLKNADTRLIIHNDPTDLEKYRRFFGIVYEGVDKDEDGNVIRAGWKAATQGTFLPQGIYFDPELVSDTPVDQEMDIEYPRVNAVEEGTGSNYFYYAFNSNGTSDNDPANAWLPLRAGNLDASGELVPYDSEGTEAFVKAALIFRKAGTVSRVSDPGAVSNN